MGSLVMATVVALSLQAPLKVRVLFGDKPAPADTEVRLIHPSPLCGTAQRRGAPMRKPDAQGWITFEDVTQEGSVRAEHPSLGSVGVFVKKEDLGRPVTLVFPAGLPLAGRVVDDEGTPVKDARVYLVPKEQPEGGVVVETNAGPSVYGIRTFLTAADGKFEFLGLGPGAYAVVADGFDDVLSPALAVDPGAKDLVVKLPTRFRVRGRVVDAEGKPVAARMVVDLSPRAKTSPEAEGFQRGTFEDLFLPAPARLNPKDYGRGLDTDAEGRFSIPVPVVGPVTLQVRADCVLFAAGEASGTTTKPLEVRLPKRSGLEARLLRKGGAPLEEVTAQFEGGEETCSLREQTLRLVDGRLALDGLPPSFSVVELSAKGLQKKRLRLALERGVVKQLGALTLAPAATLKGTLRSKDGKPVDEARIDVRIEGVEDEFSVHVDEAGAFELTALPAGPAKVTVARPDGKFVDLAKLVLREGESSSLELRLPR